MKIFLRILYSVAMVIVFWIVYSTGKQVMTEKYMEKYGDEALQFEEPNYAFFYGQIPDYNNREVLFSYSTGDFEIRMYELAVTNIDGLKDASKFEVYEYFYLMIHRKNEKHPKSTKFEVTTVREISESGGEGTSKFEINMAPYTSNLNLAAAINTEGEVYIPKEVLKFGISEMKYSEYDGNKYNELFNITGLSIECDDFKIKEVLTSYFNEHNKLPETEDELMTFMNQGIFAQNYYVADEFFYVIVWTMVIYFVILVVLSYFVFFHKWPRRKDYDKRLNKDYQKTLFEEELNEFRKRNKETNN